MTVYLVGAGPGDPGLITVRGAEVLGRADVVLYDRLSVSSLLSLAPAGAELISVGKTPRGPSTPQSDINAMLVERGRRGETVVRLKGGDPFVLARGGEEALALAAAGVPFEVVPGVTSAIAAPAYAGVPVTHRGMSTSFTVVTGHEDPWSAIETDWGAVARVGGTIVVLMGVATRGEIAARLMAGGLPGSTAVTAVSWGATPRQWTVRTTLAELGDADVRPTSVMVIGAVAAIDVSWFEKRPLFGRRVVVARAAAQAGSLSTLLRDAGADVVDVPAIRIEFVAPLAVDVAAYDWIAFTSTNAVDAVFASPAVRDARAFGPSVSVAAVGPGTAAALAARGVIADLVPDVSTAAGLADAFPPGDGRVLLPQSSLAPAALADALQSKGWSVDVVVAYRTSPAPLDAAAIDAVRGADAVALTSSSTASSLVGVVGVDGLPGVVACIGPSTAATVRESGVDESSVVVAERSTLEGLVAAVVAGLAGVAGLGNRGGG